jgi:hypothetical protein
MSVFDGASSLGSNSFAPGSSSAAAEGTFVNPSYATSGQTQAMQNASSTLSDEPIKPARDKVLRYPYARLNNESDYLMIQIAEFSAPDFDVTSLFNTDGNLKLKDEALTGGAFFNTEREINFNLPTISDNISDRLKNKKNIKHIIYLPIPEQISDTTQISWGEGTLNPAEAFGVSFASQFQDNPGKALEAALKALTTGAAGIGQNPQLLNAIQNALSATAIGALGGNVSANQLISRATGQVFNPNLELLFDGVGLRNFQFNFDFFPRNKKEAEEVILIIRTLKRRMSARRNSGGDSNVKGVFISAPHIFQLTYMKGGKKHPVLNSFLPMALVDLQINYTGSNTYSTFWDGTPTHMQMSLAFKELNPIYAEDYDNTDPKSVGY